MNKLNNEKLSIRLAIISYASLLLSFGLGAVEYILPSNRIGDVIEKILIILVVSLIFLTPFAGLYFGYRSKKENGTSLGFTINLTYILIIGGIVGGCLAISKMLWP